MDEDMEHEEVKEQLSDLMEITLRLEDELNLVIMAGSKSPG